MHKNKALIILFIILISNDIIAVNDTTTALYNKRLNLIHNIWHSQQLDKSSLHFICNKDTILIRGNTIEYKIDVDTSIHNISCRIIDSDAKEVVDEFDLKIFHIRHIGINVTGGSHFNQYRFAKSFWIRDYGYDYRYYRMDSCKLKIERINSDTLLLLSNNEIPKDYIYSVSDSLLTFYFYDFILKDYNGNLFREPQIIKKVRQVE